MHVLLHNARTDKFSDHIHIVSFAGQCIHRDCDSAVQEVQVPFAGKGSHKLLSINHAAMH